MEAGVRVVFERAQLLLQVVELDEGFKGLVQGAVYSWRAKLDDRVVLLVGLLNVSERASKTELDIYNKVEISGLT